MISPIALSALPPTGHLRQTMQPLQDALLRPACQKQHWEQFGHDKLCKKIKRAGGAEQYHANKKYTEPVVAAKACRGHEGADVLHLPRGRPFAH